MQLHIRLKIWVILGLFLAYFRSFHGAIDFFHFDISIEKVKTKCLRLVIVKIILRIGDVNIEVNFNQSHTNVLANKLYTRVLGFDSSHRQFLSNMWLHIEDENKEKRCR